MAAEHTQLPFCALKVTSHYGNKDGLKHKYKASGQNGNTDDDGTLGELTGASFGVFTFLNLRFYERIFNFNSC